MKYFTSLSALFFLFSCGTPKNQTEKKAVVSGIAPETFRYQDGGTTYTMQKYFLVLLKKGKNRNQPKEETEVIQKNHMAHLSWLHETGKISLAGPIDKHDNISGIVIFNTATLKEADSLAKLDPAVKAGRLEVETIGWWAAKGSKLK